MRKINMSWQSVLLSVALLGLAACTGDFEDINRNPNQVTEEQMDALNYKTGTKFKSLQSLVIPVQEHMYQFNESLSGGPFGGYIGATVDTWQTKFETYNPSADWRKWPFANVITETYTPYKGIVNGTEDEVAIAFARLLRVAIMHRVTDSYGPIPYSKLESNESVYVEYDSQEAVYTKMFEELDEAIEILGRNTTLPAEAWSRYDGVYYGNIAQWLKYANSLKLRMAMRLSYVKSDVARAKAAEAIAGGVIEANADNAAMHAAENRTTLIYNDWGDHRVGADILCYMNGYKDPRMEKMFLANDVGDYVGIRIGIDVTSKSQAVSKYSNMIVASDTPYLWFNAAEATFLRAEYELRWGSEETARSLYEAAVRLSFEERGASGADAYLAQTDVKPAPYTDPVGDACLTPSRSTSRTTPTFSWPSRRSMASSRTATARATSWEPVYGGIANLITTNSYETELYIHAAGAVFDAVARLVQRLDGNGGTRQYGQKALGARSCPMGRVHRDIEGLQAVGAFHRLCPHAQFSRESDRRAGLHALPSGFAGHRDADQRRQLLEIRRRGHVRHARERHEGALSDRLCRSCGGIRRCGGARRLLG